MYINNTTQQHQRLQDNANLLTSIYRKEMIAVLLSHFVSIFGVISVPVVASPAPPSPHASTVGDTDGGAVGIMEG